MRKGRSEEKESREGGKRRLVPLAMKKTEEGGEEVGYGGVRACPERIRRREWRAGMEGKVWLLPYQGATE